jgi:methionyl aminopeptidase
VSPNRDPRAFKDYKYTGKLRAFPVTPQVAVPLSIPQPDYAMTGEPESERRASSKIPVYNAEEIEGMRVACKLGKRYCSFNRVEQIKF